jgi:hypothetical protein
MATFVEGDWRRVVDGYDNGDYHIRRLWDHPRHNWRLLAAPDPEPVSQHRSLRGARARARDIERARIRATKARTHVIVGILSAVGALVMAQWITSIPTYVAFVLLAVASLHSLGYAAEVRLGDAWDWAWLRRRPPRVTRLDRVVTALVEHLHQAAAARNGPRPPDAVRALPPAPPV